MDEYEVDDSVGRTVRVRLPGTMLPTLANLQRAYELQSGTSMFGSRSAKAGPPPRLAFQQNPTVVRLRKKVPPPEKATAPVRPQAQAKSPPPPPRTTRALRINAPNPSGKPSSEGFLIGSIPREESPLPRPDALTPLLSSDLGKRIAGQRQWAQMDAVQRAYAQKRARVPQDELLKRMAIRQLAQSPVALDPSADVAQIRREDPNQPGFADWGAIANTRAGRRIPGMRNAVGMGALNAGNYAIRRAIPQTIGSTVGGIALSPFLLPGRIYGAIKGGKIATDASDDLFEWAWGKDARALSDRAADEFQERNPVGAMGVDMLVNLATGRVAPN